MKKIITFLAIVVYTSLSFGQSFNYQAAVRNNTGDLVANQAIGTTN